MLLRNLEIMTPEPSRPNSDLRALLGVLRRHRWSIVLIAIVATASALLFSYRRTPIYSSTAEVQVTPLSPSQLLTQGPYWALPNMDTEVRVAESSAVGEIAEGTMGAPNPAGSLDVSSPTNTQILQFTYSDPDPAMAQVGAQAHAEAYLAYRTQVAVTAYAQSLTAIQSQINDLKRAVTNAQERLELAPEGSAEQLVEQNTIDQLSSQIAGLKTQAASFLAPEVTPGTVIQPAELPTGPSQPNHRIDGALGLMAGIAIAAGYALVRDRLDERVRNRSDLEEATGAPVLAIVPRVPKRRRRGRVTLISLARPTSTAAEAYRTLRTNLQFIGRGHDATVFLVSSPAAGEGKSTTAANLAVTLAQTGKRVIAVSADLRRPRLHEFFGLDNTVGLTSILLAQVPRREATVKIADVENLQVICSGPITSTPTELLSSEAFAGFLDQVRAACDLVVIDGAPTLPVSDSLIVAPLADGVILVADADATNGNAAAHAVEQLRHVGANLVGSVLNNFDPSKAGRYSYYGAYDDRYVHGVPEGNGNGLATRGRTAGREAERDAAS
jgi:capsular exopolysaccharide synthesis family protein